MKKVLLLSLLFVAPLKGEDIIYQNIGPYGGLNNSDSPIAIPANKAQSLLNVDVSPGGKSIKKRKGYALFSNLSITTSAVHGVYNFFDSNGNSVDLYFNDTRISASIGGASVSVLSSTGSNGATWQCVDSQGFAYCNSSARTSLLKTNGATFSYINTVNSTGTMVAVTPERLVASGFSEAPNRIDLSKANDFTNWTIGSAATSAAQFTVVSPGSRITHIVYVFGRLIWFKDSSFGYIQIGQETAQADWQVRTISPNVGTLDNTSVYWDGLLYFRGQDGHIYAYDGSNLEKLTRDLEGTISVSGNRTANSWTQTTQTDFETSSMTPSGFLSTTINPGAIVLGTATAISDFVDDSASDFGAAASIVNLDTTSFSGSVVTSTAVRNLTLGSFVTTNVNGTPNGTGSPLGGITNGPPSLQQFQSTYTFLVSSVSLSVCNGGGIPSTYTVSIFNDFSDAVGSIVISSGHNFNGISSCPSYTLRTIVFPSSAIITSGTKYWIGVASTPLSNNLNWEQASSVNGYKFTADGISTTTSFSTVYRLHGYDYSTNGSLVSRSFDNGFSTASWLWDWSTFYASGTIPSGATLTYQTQTSSDSSCSSCWDSLVSVSSGASPTSTVKRFIRYKASFTSNAVSTSPTLNYVELNMTNRLRPNGTYYSQVHPITGAISAWDSFNVTKVDGGGSQTFYIRASTGNFTITSSTPAWTAISAGAVPSISTGVNVQIKDEFAVTKTTQSQTLNDFTINWFEGQASDKAYGTYFKDAIWWSVASGVSVSTNNRVLRLDLLNGDWYLYDIGANGFLVRNNSLYFGSSAAGKIFKFGDADSDDGSAINAYWKSKDFVLGNPFVKKEFVNLSVSAGSVSNSTMTVTYTVDGSSSTSFQFPLYAGSQNSYRNFNKNLPLGRIGSTFNVQVGNNGADQPLEVFAIQFGLREKPWVPTP